MVGKNLLEFDSSKKKHKFWIISQVTNPNYRHFFNSLAISSLITILILNAFPCKINCKIHVFEIYEVHTGAQRILFQCKTDVNVKMSAKNFIVQISFVADFYTEFS